MSSDGPSANPVSTAPLLNERYEIGERLAEGTFFYTHRGRDHESGRAVAIKVLRPEFAGDEAFSGRLLSEARSATSLQHPNIAQVYDAFRERGTVVIITEWVRGINLKDRIRRVAPFPLAVAVDILQACAEGLNYAHESGYIHGDLRPDNVIITPDGRVKVTDFGLGASVAASKQIQLAALPQAVYYLAPELAEGRSPDVGSDIYSLGCLLYEMLVAATPYEADTPLAVALKHVQSPVPSARKANPSVPNAVDGIAQKCMQKDPKARYPSLTALLGDVRQVQDAIRSDRPLTWSPLKPPVETAPVPEKTPPPRVTRPERPPKAEPVNAAPVRAAPVNAEPVKVEPAPRPEPAVRADPISKVQPVPRAEPESRRPAERPPRRPAPSPPSGDTGPSLKLLMGVALFGILMIAAFFVGVNFIIHAPEEVPVPRLAGKSQADALAQLQRIGLKGDVREDYRDREPAGTVFDTAPKPGVTLRAQKSVTLFVSKGPQPINVPDTSGKDLSAARRELKTAGLATGNTREEFSEVVPKGGVISQSPLAGNQVRKGSPVDLTISKGPEPIPDPQDEPRNSGDQQTNGGSPGQDNGAGSANGGKPSANLPEQEQEVTIEIPKSRVGPQTVKIVVRNADGTEETPYEQQHQPGETVTQMVTTRGAKGKSQIRIYLNNHLEQTVVK
jgi:serine/threonine-protein kinase